MIGSIAAMVALRAAAAFVGDPVPSALDARLASMETAVLDGDAAAYLANIDAADPEFMHEQKNWAADLKPHTPEDFDLAITEAVVSGDSADAELTMSWTMPGGRPRSVEYPVRFVRAPGEAGWLYCGERWETVEGDGVLALCAGGLGPAGQKVVEAFPAVRAHVQEGFELTVDRVQKVKLYASMAHLQASIYLSYTDGLGGWNEPGESIKIVASRDPGSFNLLLAHEFGHVCTFEMGPDAAGMPWWALEGVAELAAERFSGGRDRTDRYIRGLAEAGELGTWSEMADFRNTPQRQYHLVYPQGHHMVGYISDRFGRAARNQWLREMAQGRSVDEASVAALGLSFADLDAQWRRGLSADQAAPTPAGD
jgi:hypothetical protein